MPPVVAAAAIVGTGAIVLASMASEAQEDAQNAALAYAREQDEAALEEQKRLEEKYGLTPGELSREERLYGTAGVPGLEERTQTEAERRAGLSGEELLREGGQITQSTLDQIAKQQGMTSEELYKYLGGEPAEQLYEEITKEGVGAQFEPELEKVRMMVNQEANRRGVFGGLPEGGIRFEQLGRAGIDLAVKSAEQRITQRKDLANQLINLTQTVLSEGGTVGERALSEKERARAELNQLLANIQNQVAVAKGREANVAIGAGNIAQAGQAQSSNIISSVLGQQAGSAAATQQASLAALGDIVSAGITASQPTPTTQPSTLSSLRAEEYNPIDYLGEITGQARLQTQYPYLLGNNLGR